MQARLFASGAQLVIDGTTLLRLRGTFTAHVSAIAAALDGFTGAFGVGIIDLQAFTTGVTACPTPIAEQDWDGWLFWETFSLKSVTATISDGVNSIGLYLQMPVDTKAMRKVKQDDVIYAAVEVTEAGTSQINYHFDSRLLLALA